MSVLKDPLKQLSKILSPFGMKVFTTGSGEVAEFLEKRYGSSDFGEATRSFEQNLERLAKAPAVVIGVPNDNGAGFDRGSKKGPLGLRRHWLEHSWYERWRDLGLLDIGDVRDHPLLSEDRFLQEWVIDAVRKDRWGDHGALATELDLPVSALSILERSLECIYTINPNCRVLMLGGDHSKSLIPVQVLAKKLEPGSLGVLQFDAHTDLLQTRDGLAGSYATWSWHANEVIGRGGRLVQVGVRTSGKTKQQWKEELEVEQYWAGEVLAQKPEAFCELVVDHFKQKGVRNIYISNDIDALDPQYAAATGTPEPGGLTPELEMMLIESISKHFDVVGSDMMEVAPLLTRHITGEPNTTLHWATELCNAQLQAMLV